MGLRSIQRISTKIVTASSRSSGCNSIRHLVISESDELSQGSAVVCTVRRPVSRMRSLPLGIAREPLVQCITESWTATTTTNCRSPSSRRGKKPSRSRRNEWRLGMVTVLLRSLARWAAARPGPGRSKGAWRGRLGPLEEFHPGLVFRSGSCLCGFCLGVGSGRFVEQGGACLGQLALFRQGGSPVYLLEIFLGVEWVWWGVVGFSFALGTGTWLLPDGSFCKA